MTLLNFTTTVPVDRTITQITKVLVSHGARQVMLDYDADHTPSGISFVVVTPFGERGFRLPVKVTAVQRVLKRDQSNNRRVRAEDEQAARVAWRIVKDWIEAQMAILDTEMVTLDQIMLPYLITAEGGRTLYEVMADRHLALPAGRNEQ